MKSLTLSSKYKLALILSIGFAIFAMFFGAGNLVFPLRIGVKAGDHVMFAIIGFLSSGVVIPLLGLYAISLYEGDYMRFLRHIGKYLGWIVAALLVFLLGILIATPRTGLLTYNTFLPFFPQLAKHRLFFNAIFFLLVYLVSYQQTRIIDVLSWVLSPLKLLVLIILIVLGLAGHHQLAVPSWQPHQRVATFVYAVKLGYGTMDLLAGFFFCAFVYQSIRHKLLPKFNHLSADDHVNLTVVRLMTLLACLIGALLLGLVYGFFILVANFHAKALLHIKTQNLIGHLALLLLHHYGGLLVSTCVGLACFSTAIALNAITVEFIQQHVCCRLVSYHVILPVTLCIIFLISNMGFAWIMIIAIPVLTILYPPLLALTIGNILYQTKGWNIGSYCFYLVLAVVLLWHLIRAFSCI